MATVPSKDYYCQMKNYPEKAEGKRKGRKERGKLGSILKSLRNLKNHNSWISQTRDSELIELVCDLVLRFL